MVEEKYELMDLEQPDYSNMFELDDCELNPLLFEVKTITRPEKLPYSEEDLLRFGPDVVERIHELADLFHGANPTNKMAYYVETKILVQGGYVAAEKIKKKQGTGFMSLKDLSPLILKIMKELEMGWYEDIHWNLLVQPEVAAYIVPGIHPFSFIETMKRRSYDVFGVFDGAGITGGDDNDIRFWKLL